MAEEGKGQLGHETELDVEQNVELDVGAGVKPVTEKRVVKLTPKALLEKISALEKQRKAEFGKLAKSKESITILMGDKEHVNEVENEFNKFNVLCDKIQQVHASLLGLLPAEQASKHDIWFQAKMLNVNEFIAGTKQWLSDTKVCSDTNVSGDNVNDEHGKGFDVSNENGAAVGKDEEDEDQVLPQDSISNVSPRSHSSASRASSTRSSTSSAKRQAEAEQAALLARAAACTGRAGAHLEEKKGTA